MKIKMDKEVRELIKNMSLNKYRSQHALGFIFIEFFSNPDALSWLKKGLTSHTADDSPQAWWSWRNKNSSYFFNTLISTYHLVVEACNLSATLTSCFSSSRPQGSRIDVRGGTCQIKLAPFLMSISFVSVIPDLEAYFVADSLLDFRFFQDTL